jgi:dihydrofolate reductase
MRRVRYAVACSLDSFIAGPNGEFDWIPSDPEVDSAQDFSRYDTLLIGRRTYDVMRDHGQPTFPGKKNYIFSRTLKRADIPKSSILSTALEQTVAELRSAPDNGKDIWLFGGGKLFRTLLAARLVDEIELAVIPILLGDGIPLLPPPSQRLQLTLEKQQSYKNGTLSLTYAIVYP